MLKTRSIALIASATIVVSSSLGFGGGYLASQIYSTSNPSAITASQQNNPVAVTSATENALTPGSETQQLAQIPRTDSLTVAEIATLAAPSVVEIRTEVTVNGLRTRSYVAEGAGSGVIVSSDGQIVTNNHVIADATKITVVLQNGQSYAAALIATDSEADIALIKIEAAGLAAATLGNSDELTVGDLAVAIGNPLGELCGTVTDGIISALDREITLDGETMNLLQTNAAINPGNSGGGLFDSAGNLIGVVVAKSSGTGVEGLGFAIPINDVKTILTDLERYGSVQGRVKLGVTLLDINTDELVSMYRVTEQGVYILKTDTEGNAAAAGLISGDRIVSIDGKSIESSSAVSDLLKTVEAGQILKVEIIRDGQTLLIDVALQAGQPQV